MFVFVLTAMQWRMSLHVSLYRFYSIVFVVVSFLVKENHLIVNLSRKQ